jgi:O-antigen ligase
MNQNKNIRAVGLTLAMLVPFGLLHAFVLAEICIAVTDILFIVVVVREHQLTWARQSWFIAAMVWWVWLVICSVPAPGMGFQTAGWYASLAFALVNIRFIIFTLALQTWLLTTPAARRVAWLLLALSCLWVGIESWQQLVTATNIFGDRRWADGSLTGPFWKPRAGALYGHLLFVALLPTVMAMLATGTKFWKVSAECLITLGVVTSVLIGQRMGTAYAIMGDITMGLFIPQLRRAAVIAIVAAGLVLLATPMFSPPTHAKLVGETMLNLRHFLLSPYGELYTRATTMGLASPWHGWGYNGFRAFCTEGLFSSGFPALGIAPTQLTLGACNLHPHNYYLQALTDAGFPGLLFFTALNAIWLVTLSRGLRKTPEPMRLALFIGILTYAWPFASTDEFPTLYEPGWMFFILGLGLALSQGKQFFLKKEPKTFDSAVAEA